MSRWTGRVAIGLAGALLAATALATEWAASHSNEPGISPTTQFTPISAQVLTDPAPVLMSDGNRHLAYEVLVTNPTPRPIQLDIVEVRDPADGRVLHSLSGAGLAAQLSPLGTEPPETPPTDPPPPIETTGTVVVWLDVAVPSNDVPRKLDHRLVGSVVGPAGPRPFDVALLSLDVSTAKPVTLAAPVPAGTWLMSEGCCADVTHHRDGLVPINGELMVPQRFAIDFFKLDDQHRAWVGDPAQLTSYASYRQPIVAATAGTVVAAQDGLPNNDQLPKPPAIPGIDQTVGNHVIVQFGPEQYLLYAHMDPTSVKVKIGDKVEKGQQLGLIGTSGNSTVPHLHFQVLTQPTFFPSDSTPFVFDKFALTGRVTERIWDDIIAIQPTGTMPFAAADPGGDRTDEMPLDRDVVRVGAQ
jgi:hypothetical protein